MSLTLYHYVHCPFCVRVRMALGFLDLPYESRVLPYDDEKTPVELTGKKMLPILTHEKGAMNESLDIIDFLDKNNYFKISEVSAEFEALLNKLGSSVHSLAMPYWIYTPEFNDISRKYFQKKKEEKRGPFKNLVKYQAKYIHDLDEQFKSLLKDINPFYQSREFGIKDIMLASHLWGLYVVPEFQFPEKLHLYLQRVKKECSFNYHQDFWR